MIEDQEPCVEKNKRMSRPRILGGVAAIVVIALILLFATSSPSSPAKKSALHSATGAKRFVPRPGRGLATSSEAGSKASSTATAPPATTAVGKLSSGPASGKVLSSTSSTTGSPSPTGNRTSGGGTNSGNGGTTPTTQPTPTPTTTPTTQPTPPPTPTTTPGVNGSIIQTFSNSGAQWNVLSEMGTMVEPADAMRGAVSIYVVYSGCPYDPNSGDNAGFVVSSSGGTFERANVPTSFTGMMSMNSSAFGPGEVFNIESSCQSITVHIIY